MTLKASSSGDRHLVRVSSNGRVDLVAEERDDVVILGSAEVVREGDTTTISGESGRLQINVPVGSDVVIGTVSGRVEVSGEVGALSVVTETGRVVVERARSVDVRSNTGRIEIGRTEEHCCVRSESGSVSVASCQHANVATGTGKIALNGVRGAVHAHCTSGRIDIRMDSANDVEAETVTGRIAVSLPRGVRAFRTEATDNEVTPDGADCTVVARSVTGRVDVGNR